MGDIYANSPIHVGLDAGLVLFVAVSLATGPTSGARMQEWDSRSAGQAVDAPAAAGDGRR